MQLSRERNESRLYLALMVLSALALVGVVVFGMVLPNLHLTAGRPEPAATAAPKQPLPEAAYRALYQKDPATVKARLVQAAGLFRKADQAFPADARPTPSLA